VNSANSLQRKLTGFSRQYHTALRKHLQPGRLATELLPAIALGQRAMTIGLETLDLARIHEQALTLLILPDDAKAGREVMVRRAGVFFAKAITPIEKTHRTAHEAGIQLQEVMQTLKERSAALVASNRELEQEIVQRKSVEESLRKSEQHYGQLLMQSRNMQEQLRQLSRQLLSAQEQERKMISRELHDVIAQTLTSINIRLASLKKDAMNDTKGLDRNIARTQKLVEKSVSIVHRFARELRPTVLDDLGLIPALHTYMKTFREETGIRVSLSAFAGVEQINGDHRTVFYRIAQEALNNVARHAEASQVEVKIQKVKNKVCMTVKDNGKGFPAKATQHANKNRRLGLLGMRERLDMIGGVFTVESTPGRGTTVCAEIPLVIRSLAADAKIL
jgi:signal transduction histidine kinase